MNSRAATAAPAVRSLPVRPSMRYLKLEAKRRLAAGEFPALYAAQLAIAREHGQPSWAALKRLVEGPAAAGGQVRQHVRWAVSRFRDAAAPGWRPPAAGELRQHFSDDLLRRVPRGELIAAISEIAANAREVRVIAVAPLAAQIRCPGLKLFVTVDADPPHLMTRVRRFPLGSRITGRPGRALVSDAVGEVPAAAREMAADAATELGLPGLVLAGGGQGGREWAITAGWADLDQRQALTVAHRFPACRVTRLVTVTAALRLVADRELRLSDTVGKRLLPAGLAGRAVTVADLLSAVGKAADSAYEALGQLIADVTGSAYADAVTRLVLEPLGMSGSSFPSWPGSGADAVTGYQVTRDIALAPVPWPPVSLAASGMWTTATDLARFGARWPSLLTEELAREALRPHPVSGVGGLQAGLGWLTGHGGNIAGLAGGCPGAFASLLVRADERRGSLRSCVVLTNRQLPILDLNVRLLIATGSAGTASAGQPGGPGDPSLRPHRPLPWW